jgi:hypothetical protein
MILLIEGPRSAPGKLKCPGIDRHEEISCAARYHLARPAVAQASENLTFHALVADFSTVTSASDDIRRAHTPRVRATNVTVSVISID